MVGGWRDKQNPLPALGICEIYRAITFVVLKAVKVRMYPSQKQESHVAPACDRVRWVWNQSLATIS